MNICTKKQYIRNNYPGGGKECIRMIENKIKDELNNYCVECGEEKPEYISINNGVFLCGECIQNHLKLPQEISTIIKNDLESLTLSEIQYIYCGGNKNLLNFINQEFPKLTEFPPNLLYKTQAMYYYRKRLLYFINGGLEPRKPTPQQGYTIVENLEPSELFDQSLYTTFANKKINNFSYIENPEKTQTLKNYNDCYKKNFSNNSISNDWNYNINTEPNNKKNNIFLRPKPTYENIGGYLRYDEQVLNTPPNCQYYNQKQINNSPQKIKINIKINNKKFESDNKKRTQFNSKKEIPFHKYKKECNIYRKPILALSPKQKTVNNKHNLLKDRTLSVDLFKPRITFDTELYDENNENKIYINEYLSDKSSNNLENLQNSPNQKINLSSLNNSNTNNTKNLAKSISQNIFNSPCEICNDTKKNSHINITKFKKNAINQNKRGNKDNKTDTKFSSDENNNSSKAYERILNVEELQVIPKKKIDLDDEGKITDEEVFNIFAEFEKMPIKINLKCKVNENALSDSEIKNKKEKNEILKKLLQSKRNKNSNKTINIDDKNIVEDKNTKLKEEKLIKNSPIVIKETVREFTEEKENTREEKISNEEDIIKDIESTKKKENLTEGNDENEEKKEEIYAKKNRTYKVKDVFSPIVPSQFFNLFSASDTKSKNKTSTTEGNIKQTKEKKNETIILNPRRKYYQEKKEKQNNNNNNKIISNVKEKEKERKKEIIQISRNIRQREKEKEKEKEVEKETEKEKEKEKGRERIKREYRLYRSKENTNEEKNPTAANTKKDVQKSPLISKNSRERVTLTHYSRERKYESTKQNDDKYKKENNKKEETKKEEIKKENKNVSIRNKYKQNKLK